MSSNDVMIGTNDKGCDESPGRTPDGRLNEMIGELVDDHTSVLNLLLEEE